jgi:outer membrane protein assembly factor BamB
MKSSSPIRLLLNLLVRVLTPLILGGVALITACSPQGTPTSTRNSDPVNVTLAFPYLSDEVKRLDVKLEPSNARVTAKVANGGTVRALSASVTPSKAVRLVSLAAAGSVNVPVVEFKGVLSGEYVVTAEGLDQNGEIVLYNSIDTMNFEPESSASSVRTASLSGTSDARPQVITLERAKSTVSVKIAQPDGVANDISFTAEIGEVREEFVPSSDRAGTLTATLADVPTGSDLMLLVEGRDGANLLRYQGQTPVTLSTQPVAQAVQLRPVTPDQSTPEISTFDIPERVVVNQPVSLRLAFRAGSPVVSASLNAAAVSWGDGRTERVPLSGPSQSLELRHSYSAVGAHIVSVVATNSFRVSGSAYRAITVIDPAGTTRNTKNSLALVSVTKAPVFASKLVAKFVPRTQPGAGRGAGTLPLRLVGMRRGEAGAWSATVQLLKGQSYQVTLTAYVDGLEVNDENQPTTITPTSDITKIDLAFKSTNIQVPSDALVPVSTKSLSMFTTTVPYTVITDEIGVVKQISAAQLIKVDRKTGLVKSFLNTQGITIAFGIDKDGNAITLDYVAPFKRKLAFGAQSTALSLVLIDPLLQLAHPTVAQWQEIIDKVTKHPRYAEILSAVLRERQIPKLTSIDAAVSAISLSIYEEYAVKNRTVSQISTPATRWSIGRNGNGIAGASLATVAPASRNIVSKVASRETAKRPKNSQASDVSRVNTQFPASIPYPVVGFGYYGTIKQDNYYSYSIGMRSALGFDISFLQNGKTISPGDNFPGAFNFTGANGLDQVVYKISSLFIEHPYVLPIDVCGPVTVRMAGLIDPVRGTLTSTGTSNIGGLVSNLASFTALAGFDKTAVRAIVGSSALLDLFFRYLTTSPSIEANAKNGNTLGVLADVYAWLISTMSDTVFLSNVLLGQNYAPDIVEAMVRNTTLLKNLNDRRTASAVIAALEAYGFAQYAYDVVTLFLQEWKGHYLEAMIENGPQLVISPDKTQQIRLAWQASTRRTIRIANTGCQSLKVNISREDQSFQGHRDNLKTITFQPTSGTIPPKKSMFVSAKITCVYNNDGQETGFINFSGNDELNEIQPGRGNKSLRFDVTCDGSAPPDPGDPAPQGGTNGLPLIVSGDPHITTPDGFRFDSQAFGEFTYLRPRSSTDTTGLVIQGRQTPFGAAAILSAVAVKVNNHVIEVRKGDGELKSIQPVLIDGQPIPSTSSFYDLGGGASVQTIARGVSIRDGTNQVDVVGGRTNLNLLVGVPLDGRLSGLLGTPNGDPNDDYRLPDGTTATDSTTLGFQISDGWRIRTKSESLFTYAPGEGPETYNKTNTLGLPTAAEIARVKVDVDKLFAQSCAPGTVPASLSDAAALDLFLGLSQDDVAGAMCGYELKGKLVNTTTPGVPIAGARVRVSSSAFAPCEVFTAADGSYSCRTTPTPNGGTPTATLEVDGVAPIQVVFDHQAKPGEIVSVSRDVNAPLTTLHLTGVLTDADNKPLPNTPVKLETPDQTRTATSDATGRYEFYLAFSRTLTTDFLVTLSAQTPGLTASRSVGVRLAVDALKEQTENLQLNRSVRFDGTLQLTGVGDPRTLGGTVIVNLSGGRELCRAGVDQYGRYQCDAQVSSSSAFDVTYAASGDWGNASDLGGGTVSAGASELVKGLSVPGTALSRLHITGRVLNSLGTGIPGAVVTANGDGLSGGLANSAITDAQGQYALEGLLKPGVSSSTVAVSTSTNGIYRLSNVSFDNATSGTVTNLSADLRLARRVHFSGTVRTADALNALPLVGSVAVSRTGGAALCSTSSNTSGGFDCFADLDSSQGFDAAITASGDWGTVSGTLSVPTGSDTTVGADLKASVAVVHLGGKVKDPNGNGLAMATVNLVSSDLISSGYAPGERRTDLTGAYSLDLVLKTGTTAGQVGLRAVSSDGKGGTTSQASFSSASAGVLTPLTFDLSLAPRALLHLVGAVTDASGNGIANAPVRVASAALAAGNTTTTTTDPTGHYAFDLVLGDGVTGGQLELATSGVLARFDFSGAVGGSIKNLTAPDLRFVRRVQFGGVVRNATVPSYLLIGDQVLVKRGDTPICAATVQIRVTAGSPSDAIYACEADFVVTEAFEASVTEVGAWGSVSSTVSVPAAGVGTDPTLVTRDLSAAPTMLHLSGTVKDTSNQPSVGANLSVAGVGVASVNNKVSLVSDARGHYDGYLLFVAGQAQADLGLSVRDAANNQASASLQVPLQANTLLERSQDFALENRQPGQGRWSAGTNPSAVTLGPSGTIYAGGGKLSAFNPDGSPRWSYDSLGASVPAVGSDGSVYFGGNRLTALNPDGTVRWQVVPNGGIGQPALAPDGTVYAVSSDGQLNAVNPNGSRNWSVPTPLSPSDALTAPSLAPNGLIYVVGGGKLSAFKPDGSSAWRFDAAGSIAGLAVRADGTILLSVDNTLVTLNDLGGLVSSQRFDGSLSSPSLGANGTVYLGSSAGKLYAVSSDGQTLWTFTGSETLRSPLVADDGVYVGSSNGQVWAVNPDGSQRWVFNASAAVGGLSMGSDGTLYVSADKVYAVNTASHGLAVSSWPKTNANAANSGFTAGDGLPRRSLNLSGTVQNAFGVSMAVTVKTQAGQPLCQTTSGLDDRFTCVIRTSSLAAFDLTLTATGASGSVSGTATVAAGAADSLTPVSATLSLPTTPGTTRWVSPVNAVSAPAIGADGTVYVSSSDGTLKAINPNRTQKWSLTVGAGATGPALALDGTVYVGTGRALVAVNPDGTQKWSAALGGAATAPAVGADGTVYVFSSDQVLHSIRPDGTQNWAIDPKVRSGTTPVIAADGTIYMYNAYTRLFAAINPDGSVKWRTETVRPGFSPVIDDAGAIYAQEQSEGSLLKINPTDGSVQRPSGIGSYDVVKNIVISPDGTRYVVKTLQGSYSKEYFRLAALTPTGETKWQVSLESLNAQMLVAADGSLYVTDDTHLRVFNADGSVKWTANIPSNLWGLSLAPGVVYGLSSDGQIYAINAEPSGLANTGWPKQGRDSANSNQASVSNTPRRLLHFNGLLRNANLTSKTFVGATVRVQRTGGEVLCLTTTDADGHYACGSQTNEMGAFDLTYTVSTPSINGPAAFLPTNIAGSAPAGATGDVVQNLDLQLPTLHLSGTVKDEAGQPVSGATLSVFLDGGTQASFTTQTDASGGYSTDFTFRNGIASVALELRASSAGVEVTKTLSVGLTDSALENQTADFVLTARAPGTVRWSTTLGARTVTTPVIGGDGTLYTTTSEGKLFALNPDKTQRWAYDAGGAISGPPVVAGDGTVYAIAGTALHAVNPDGTLRWSSELGGVAHGPALAADGTTYLVTGDGQLIAVDSDGTKTWSLALGGRAFAAPSIDATGMVYVMTAGGVVHAVTPDGTPKWTLSVGGSAYSTTTPIIGADGTIYASISSDTSYYGYGGRSLLLAINPDGSQRWFQWLGGQGSVSSAPVIGADGTLYVASSYSTNQVRAFGPDGSLRWSFDPGVNVRFGTPTVASDGTILAPTLQGRLYALNPDGTQRWVWSEPDSYSLLPASIGADGTVYVGTTYGLLEAVNSSATGLAASPWAREGHDNLGANRAPFSGAALRSVRFEGTVADSTNPNARFAGTGVSIIDSSSGAALCTATADASGAFVCGSLTAKLGAFGATVRVLTRSFPADVPAGAAGSVTRVLKNADITPTRVRLSGTVRGADGQPVPNATVEIGYIGYTYIAVATATADANGAYSLPPLEFGTSYDDQAAQGTITRLMRVTSGSDTFTQQVSFGVLSVGALNQVTNDARFSASDVKIYAADPTLELARGETFTEPVFIENVGGTRAQNVVFTIQPSAGLTIDPSSLPSDLNCSSGPVFTCTVDTLERGALVEVDLSGTVDSSAAPDSLSLQYRVRTDSPESDTANNDSSTDVTVVAPFAQTVGPWLTQTDELKQYAQVWRSGHRVYVAYGVNWAGAGDHAVDGTVTITDVDGTVLYDDVLSLTVGSGAWGYDSTLPVIASGKVCYTLTINGEHLAPVCEP